MSTPLDQDTQPKGAPSDPEIGRILFQRRTSAHILWLLGLLLGGATILAVPQSSPKWVENACAATVLLGTVVLWHALTGTIRCGDRGVDRIRLLGRTTLSYEELGSVAYWGQRIGMHGIPLGHYHYLSLRPRHGCRGDGIFFITCYWSSDDILIEMRRQIEEVIETRMLSELSVRGAVEWTESLRILAEGIEYRPAGFLGPLEPVLLPMGELAGFTENEYYLFVWRKEHEKPVFKEMLRRPNLRPGRRLAEAQLLAYVQRTEPRRPALD